MEQARKISVHEAAARLGCSDQFVRIGLQRGILPIGCAVQMTAKRYTYHISPALLEQYAGKED